MTKRSDKQVRRWRRPLLTLRRRHGNLSKGGVILMAGVASATVVFVVICVVVLHRERHVDVAPAELLSAGREVRLPAQRFADRQAHFYRYPAKTGREVRFFVIQGSDGVIQAALDTCEFCYRERRGYRLDGDAMVCNSCGRRFSTPRLAVARDGCNPTSLEHVLEGNDVRLQTEALELGARYF